MSQSLKPAQAVQYWIFAKNISLWSLVYFNVWKSFRVVYSLKLVFIEKLPLDVIYIRIDKKYKLTVFRYQFTNFSCVLS